MRKLGFTLIELLAVILIIGIIALITTPVVLNIINESKKQSFKNSVLSVFKASELYEVKNDFEKISNDGINIKDESLPLENGSFTNGMIIRNSNDKLEVVNVTDGVYCAKGTITDLRVVKGGCYKLDETSPIDVLISFDSVTSSSFRVNVSAVDNESGIRDYSYSLDGKNYNTTVNNNYIFNNLTMNENYIIYVRVTNNNGLTSESVTKIIRTKELNEPIYSIDKTGWQTSKIVTILYSEKEENFIYDYSIDGGSNWIIVEDEVATVEFTSNGSVIARIYDGTNYKTASSYTVTGIDTTSPSVNTALINKTTNSITLKAIGIDEESEITEYEFSIDNGSYVSNGLNDTYMFKNLTAGNHTVRVRVTNGSGLKTESDSITLSPKEIDEPTYSIDKTGWQTQKIVTITYPARQTGFIYQYSIDGGSSWVVVASGVTKTVTFTSNGSVIARIYDGTNYKTASSYTVSGIDTTVPIVSIALTGKTTNSVMVTATGIDAESGIINYEFKINSGSYVSNGTNANYTFNNVTTGSHTVRVRVTNGSGLSTESTGLTVSPNDITVPTYSIDKSGWQQSKTVTITYPTRQTGFVYQYSIDGGTSWTTVTSGTTATRTFTSNGNIIARIYDGTNYKIASTYSIEEIDTKGPTYSYIEVKNLSSSGYDVYVYGVEDLGSGVNRVQFPTWTNLNGQDDIQSNWNTNPAATGVNLGNKTWYYRVNTSAHNNESGIYNTHIYLYDNLNNVIGIVLAQQNVPVKKVTAKLPEGNYTVGQSVAYAGISWHVINVNGSEVTLLADHGTIASKMMFDTKYNSSYPSCAYSPTGYCGNNIWSSSDLKTYLNGTWLTNSQLSTEYMVDNGSGYVRLITHNEYNTLKSSVGSQSWLYSATINWWWTMTNANEYKLHAVMSDGNVSPILEAFDNSYARPVVTVQREINYTCSKGTLTYDASKGYICVFAKTESCYYSCPDGHYYEYCETTTCYEVTTGSSCSDCGYNNDMSCKTCSYCSRSSTIGTMCPVGSCTPGYSCSYSCSTGSEYNSNTCYINATR